jgi:hypothetical protein
MTLFLTNEQQWMHGALAWRWRQLAKQGTEIVRLRGTHDQTLDERSAESLAKHLTARLDGANRPCESRSTCL